jgi:hypothetical protein
MTNDEKIVKALAALTDAMSKLPQCKCGKVATKTSLDAAHDPWPTCDEHSHPGGFDGDEGPFPRSYVSPLQEALAALSDDASNLQEWGDVDDEWTAKIAEAHPLRIGSHLEYAKAMMMVGHRYSKTQLVQLVCWLLVEIRKLTPASHSEDAKSQGDNDE